MSAGFTIHRVVGYEFLGQGFFVVAVSNDVLFIFLDNDSISMISTLRRPNSLPALKTRTPLVTEEALIEHYRRYGLHNCSFLYCHMY